MDSSKIKINFPVFTDTNLNFLSLAYIATYFYDYDIFIP